MGWFFYQPIFRLRICQKAWQRFYDGFIETFWDVLRSSEKFDSNEKEVFRQLLFAFMPRKMASP
jgi:hypothetical protein